MRQAALCSRFHKAIELIGRRWSGAIIQLLLRRPARFAELRAAIPNITDRMLSERLSELEAEGLVRRRVTAGVPVRVQYELSAKGRDLERTMVAIGSWARQWLRGQGSQAAARSSAVPFMTASRGRTSLRKCAQGQGVGGRG